MPLGPTPSQTVGPFFALGLARLLCVDLAAHGVGGERLAVTGRMVDGDGLPVPDGFLEIWQADARGRYAHPEQRGEAPADPGFRGFGRVPTGTDGRFRFDTVKPGAVPGPGGGPQAPHLAVWVFARGLMRPLYTRMYFPAEEANARDAVLATVDPGRRGTLLASKAAEAGVLAWDVVLQGPGETVFFDC